MLSVQSMIFDMSLSPSGALLAAIDVSGNLSLWEVPAFRRKEFWHSKQLVRTVRHHCNGIIIMQWNGQLFRPSILVLCREVVLFQRLECIY